VKVVDIVFAYNNYQLIALLKKRGTAIASLQFEAMDKLDREIIDLIMNTEDGEPKKDDNGVESEINDAYDSLTRPVCTFITFETDDGYLEALNYSKRNWFQRRYAEYRGQDADGNAPLLLGRAVNFTAASEPTNIIWENRHIKGANYFARFMGAVFWLAGLIVGAFFLIFLAKK